MKMARVRTGMRERARSLVDARLDERREPWMPVPRMMHNLHDTAEDGSSMTRSSTRDKTYLLQRVLSTMTLRSSSLSKPMSCAVLRLTRSLTQKRVGQPGVVTLDCEWETSARDAENGRVDNLAMGIKVARADEAVEAASEGESQFLSRIGSPRAREARAYEGERWWCAIQVAACVVEDGVVMPRLLYQRRA